MFKYMLKTVPNAIRISKFSTSASEIAPSNIPKWELLTAVCVERKPVITPELNDLEKEYREYLADVEFSKSLKCDHELRHEAEIKQLEQLKSGKDLDYDVNLKQTAQDIVDANLEELSKFKFGSRITEDDKSNNVKSLNRKLDKHLVLVTKQKIGNKDYYLLPQAERNDGETLRQTADRVLQLILGKSGKAQIYGNAPSGIYKYKYPKDVRKENGVIGAKVFIYFARHLEGNIGAKGVDFKWLDRQELGKVLPEEYRKSVTDLLIDE